MAEKGGKGFSLSKGKGTNLSSAKKSKNKPQVHFSSSDSDSDASPSPSPIPTPKGGGKSNGLDFSKGGKSINDKTGAPTPAGKPPITPKKSPATPAFDIESELPMNAKCMMDCEAQEVLHKIQEHLVILSEDPTIKLPESFHKGIQYAKLGGGYKSVDDVKRVLGMLKKSNVSDSEICLIANICPDDADEVFALMPKLKAKRKKTETGIDDVIMELVELKTVKDGDVGGMDLD